MSLNKVKIGSNMYPFLNDYPHMGANRGYTINFVKGRCPFQCIYCYYQSNPRYKKRIGELRLDEKEFKTNIGSGNYIFVGSSCDMFAEAVPNEWIKKVLDYCKRFDNKYLFQSKNPDRFWDFRNNFPSKVILGTTIETNRCFLNNSKLIVPETRVNGIWGLKSFDKIVSIEPIMYFDLEQFVEMIKAIKPLFVSIGADSKKSGLNEPPAEKIRELINELGKFTEVKIKNNLSRLLG